MRLKGSVNTTIQM